MNVYPSARGYLAELDNQERNCLMWACEVARALLLRDEAVYLLIAEQSVPPDVLDDLTDSLFLAGCPEPGTKVVYHVGTNGHDDSFGRIVAEVVDELVQGEPA